jgi:hypothetical protein
MDKELFKGIKIALGFLLVFGVLGIVTAAGFHYANEIVPGDFQDGDYSFNGILSIGTTTYAQPLNSNLNVYNSNLKVVSDTDRDFNIGLKNNYANRA